MIIRVILILLIIVLLMWILRQHSTTRRQAWSKIGAFALFLFAIVAVLAPGVTNDIAHVVGVGRGADLLLYCLTIVFIGTVIGQFMHRHEETVRIIKLARKVAIIEAAGVKHNQVVLKDIGFNTEKIKLKK